MPRPTSCRSRRSPTRPTSTSTRSYDPVLDEVSAFEELVGCHGGLGGWQTRPLLVHPAAWSLDPDLLDDRGRLRGADVVHRQLVRWLERLGHRTDLPPDGRTVGRTDASTRTRRPRGTAARAWTGRTDRPRWLAPPAVAQPEERARGRSARPGCAGAKSVSTAERTTMGAVLAPGQRDVEPVPVEQEVQPPRQPCAPLRRGQREDRDRGLPALELVDRAHLHAAEPHPAASAPRTWLTCALYGVTTSTSVGRSGRGNSYLVGFCTGRSAGFSPLRMRSTYEAERRIYRPWVHRRSGRRRRRTRVGVNRGQRAGPPARRSDRDEVRRPLAAR